MMDTQEFSDDSISMTSEPMEVLCPQSPSTGNEENLDPEAQFQLFHRKFNRACGQMTLIDMRIQDCQTRYNRAMKASKNAFRYSLRLRLAVLTGVKMMFYEYAKGMADKMDNIRDLIEDERYTPGDSSEGSDSEDDQ